MPTEQNNSTLRIEGLAVGYGEHPVQQDLSFDVRSGSIFAIMGASGCGKSTVMKALVGLLRPSAGEVFFGSENYWSQAEGRRAEIGRRFGVSFQEGALWSSMTASQNVALPLQMFTGLDAAAIDALVQMKLSLVGLNAGRASMPADLSGGMRKRVGLARALSLDPEILFLDEPSAGLDPISSKGVDDLILSLRDGFGITVVMVSHELPSLLAICDDGVFLDTESKTAIAHGAPRTMLETCKHPTVIAFMNRAEADGSRRKEED